MKGRGGAISGGREARGSNRAFLERPEPEKGKAKDILHVEHTPPGTDDGLVARTVCKEPTTEGGGNECDADERVAKQEPEKTQEVTSR